MPSTCNFVPAFPWNVPPTAVTNWPPTSEVPVSPGVSDTSPVWFFVLVGSTLSRSLDTNVCRRTFAVSTSGLAPLTVIVS